MKLKRESKLQQLASGGINTAFGHLVRVKKVNNMRALSTFKVVAILAALLDCSSPSAVPEIKFADLKSAIETENLNTVKDAGGKFGSFIVTDIPTVGYTGSVADLVRELCSDFDSFPQLSNKRFPRRHSFG